LKTTKFENKQAKRCEALRSGIKRQLKVLVYLVSSPPYAGQSWGEKRLYFSNHMRCDKGAKHITEQHERPSRARLRRAA
jgi:hypothetical protein